MSVCCPDHWMASPVDPAAGAPLPAAGLGLGWFNQWKERPICMSSDYIFSSWIQFDANNLIEKIALPLQITVADVTVEIWSSILWAVLSFHFCLSFKKAFIKLIFSMVFYLPLLINTKFLFLILFKLNIFVKYFFHPFTLFSCVYFYWSSNCQHIAYHSVLILSSVHHPVTPTPAHLPFTTPFSLPRQESLIFRVPVWYFPLIFPPFPFIPLNYLLFSPTKWDHITFVLLPLTYCTKHNTLLFHPHWSKWWVYVISNGWLIFNCIHRPQLLYPSSVNGHWSSFHSVATVDIAARNIRVQVSWGFPASISLG